jgi:hypothetical protein
VKHIDFDTADIRERMAIADAYMEIMVRHQHPEHTVLFLKSMIDAKLSPSFAINEKLGIPERLDLRTPFHVAIERKSVELTKLLLDAKADINQKMDWSWSIEHHHKFGTCTVNPLGFTLKVEPLKGIDFIKFLLKNGASINELAMHNDKYEIRRYRYPIDILLGEIRDVDDDKVAKDKNSESDKILSILNLFFEHNVQAHPNMLKIACEHKSLNVIRYLIDHKVPLGDSIIQFLSNDYLIEKCNYNYINTLKMFKKAGCNFDMHYLNSNGTANISSIDKFIRTYYHLTIMAKKNNHEVNMFCFKILKFILYNSQSTPDALTFNAFNFDIIHNIFDSYPRWFRIRLVFIAYYKNKDNKQCLFNRLPLEMIKEIIKTMFDMFDAKLK